MNLNKNNLFARYYVWMYEDLPNDVCTFFWGSLFIVLFSILLIPGRLLGDYTDGVGEYFAKGLFMYFAIALLIVFGVAPYSIFGLNDFLQQFHFLITLVILFVTGILEVLAIVGAVYAIKYFYEKRREKKAVKRFYNEDYQSFWEKTGNFVGAIRGKYCTKINWK